MNAILARSHVEVLKHQVEQAEACGRSYVEVPLGTLRQLVAGHERFGRLPDETFEALELVGAERVRQEELKAAGRFPWSCADYGPSDSRHGPSDSRKLGVLVEEVGEVARAVQWVEAPDAFDVDLRRLEVREELVHVAAVAVAWIESMP